MYKKASIMATIFIAKRKQNGRGDASVDAERLLGLNMAAMRELAAKWSHAATPSILQAQWCPRESTAMLLNRADSVVSVWSLDVPEHRDVACGEQIYCSAWYPYASPSGIFKKAI